MGNVSNYKKATLFFSDITDTAVTAKKEQSFTLQRFSYTCVRQRNSMGEPYGPTLTQPMQFVIKSLPDGYLKELYRRLTENSASVFSVVFHATFRLDESGDGVLSDYDSALIVSGAVVDVSEDYDTLEIREKGFLKPERATTVDLMMTTVDLLLQSIVYVGNNGYQKKLYINY